MSKNASVMTPSVVLESKGLPHINSLKNLREDHSRQDYNHNPNNKYGKYVHSSQHSIADHSQAPKVYSPMTNGRAPAQSND